MSALRGIKVLELSESVSGEYCGKLLSDFGADIIKLEKPGCGSPTRRLGPFAPEVDAPERSGLFAYLNTNKSSIELDVATVAGSNMLGKLLDHVDVIIDDHPVGWLKSVGMDPDSLHESYPKLILCSITPFGQLQSEDHMHARDLNVFHSSGWGYHTPSAADDSLPPLKGAGRFLASYEAGLDAALCVAAAVYEQVDSHQGQFIDISMQQVLASRTDYVLAQMVAGDMEVSTDRRAFDLHGPADIYPCQDGYVYIWMSSPEHWKGLHKLLGYPEWMNAFPENWLELECTPERVAECQTHIAEWLKTQNKIEVAEEAQKLGLVLVPVNNARDLLSSPQYEYREFFTEVSHPLQGTASYPTVPYKLSVTPVKIETPAPLLGQHTEERLATLSAASMEAKHD